MSLPAASFEPVISYLNLASPGAEIRSGKTDKSASLRQSGHTTTKHEGAKYACDQCEYKANRQETLTSHIQARHEGVEYACDHCNYKTLWKTNLHIHKKANH